MYCKDCKYKKGNECAKKGFVKSLNIKVLQCTEKESLK